MTVNKLEDSAWKFFSRFHLSKLWPIWDKILTPGKHDSKNVTKVKAHPKKYIVQIFLLLIKQMKFKIYTRKTPLAASRWTSTTFLFCQDKHKLHVLDSPSPLQSQLSTTLRVYLVPPPKSVWMYGHTVTWLPNFFGWIDYQIVLAMGLRSRALHAFVELRYKFSCEITKLSWQHSVDISVSTWLTLDQNSTNMWLALNSHMDRYVSQHSLDMLTNSLHYPLVS